MGWRRRGGGREGGTREGGEEGKREKEKREREGRLREENNWEAIRQVVPTEYENGSIHCEGLDTEENAVPNKDLLPLPYLQHVSHAAHVSGLFLFHG